MVRVISFCPVYIAFAPNYVLPLPPGHRFPMEKYGLLPEQLLYEGTASPEDFVAPDRIAVEDILAVHMESYWHKLSTLSLTPKEARKTGFPQSRALMDREVTIAGGTIQAALHALQYGAGANIAGGTHHAFTDRGEGFCLLNDQALAARYLIRHGHIDKALIVDLDVHQGNGTAEIFADDPTVYTFSMHCAQNYPLHKERSDWDIGLEVGTSDALYLATLAEALATLLPQVRPDIVFYQAGVDVLATDKLGHLALTLAGCRARDRLVFSACKQAGLPVVVCMGGGYSTRLATIIEAHAGTFRELVRWY